MRVSVAVRQSSGVMSAAIGTVALLMALVLLLLRLQLAAVIIAVATLGITLSDVVGGIQGGGSVSSGLMTAASQVATLLSDLLRSEAIWMVPPFVLLGNLAFYAGISTRIYDAASVWLSRVRGGQAMAAVLGCGGFAAISGSSIACASTMGRICVPEMLKSGYAPRLAASSVAVGGTLGSLIPPSVLFILFGLFTDSPVAKLFMAGLLPGLLSLLGMLAVIALWVRDEPGAAPEAPGSESSRLDALFAIWPAVTLFVILIGGLFTGVLAPASAAVICVVLTVVIGVVQGRLNADNLLVALRESLRQIVSILLAVVAAKLFIGFLSQSGTSDILVDAVRGWGLPMLAVIAIVAVIYLLLGMFLEPMAVLILTLPLAIPLIHSYEMNPIWFGVLVVKMLEIGLITPPVGLNVFVLGNVTRDIRLDTIFAGVARFLMVEALVLLALILFPVLSTLLPSLMSR